jgi:hypothetical protein
MKRPLKLKINPIWEYLGFTIYPIKPSAGLFILIKSHETISLIIIIVPATAETKFSNFPIEFIEIALYSK